MRPATGKFGKLPAKHDTRTLRLASYLDVGKASGSKDFERLVLDVPDYQDRGKHVLKNGGYQMHANNRWGCCVLAARGHALATVTACELGSPTRALDSEILADYRDVGGWQGNDATDNGAYLLDSLKHWRLVGMLAGGTRHKILAFASLDVQSREEIAIAVFLFGGFYGGYRLPIAAQYQDKWTHYGKDGLTGDYAPSSWGNHCMFAARTSDAQLGLITWGYQQMANHGFVQTYCDEAYVALQTDWQAIGKAPPGFDLQQLLSDVRARGAM
jgi:hypothetical protein